MTGRSGNDEHGDDEPCDDGQGDGRKADPHDAGASSGAIADAVPGAAAEAGLEAEPVAVPAPDQRKHAVLVLTTPQLIARDLGRYLYILVRTLQLSGHRVTLCAEAPLRAALAEQKFTAQLLRRDLIAVRDPADVTKIAADDLTHADLIWLESGAHDTADLTGALNAHPTAKRVHLVYGKALTATPNRYDLLFPYPLHPKFYKHGEVRDVARHRSSDRPTRILFIGNVSARYADVNATACFETPSRPAMLQHLQRTLPAGALAVGDVSMLAPTNASEAAPSLRAGMPAREVVLLDTASGGRIAKDAWLPTLSQADFWLACPGVDMALCHNIVEAMAVGTIPITGYGALFDPPLQQGESALTFASLEELEVVVRAALALDLEARQRLREGVIAHYERHLTPSAFMGKVAAWAGPDLRVGLNFMPA
ncbi:MAG: hypothetical protein AAFR04_02280 [Pseudomonadota bacterium]